MIVDDFVDHLSVRWGLLLYLMVLMSIVVVLIQIKTADTLDGMRHHASKSHLLFVVRRAAMFAKLLALCWTVVYGYQHQWHPWPPMVLFLAAFNVHSIAYMIIMRNDLWELRRLRRQGLASRS